MFSTISTYCDADEAASTFCEWLRDTLTDNVAATIERADQLADTDHYWHQISLYFHQMNGLYNGWQEGADRARASMELEFVDVLLLNAAADLSDMRVYFENFVRTPPTTTPSTDDMEYHPTPTKASMLLKFVFDRAANATGVNATYGHTVDQPDDLRPGQVLIGHSSAGNYTTMLRMMKRYKFHYHRTQRSHHEVAGIGVVFTGYPGALASSDDFYIVSGRRTKLTVAGIRMQNANIDLWRPIDVRQSVLLAARVMAANRLAHNGCGWAHVMSGHPGFGSKQWMVVDVARLHNDTALQTNGTDFVQLSRVSAGAFSTAETTPIEHVTAVAPDWRKHLLWIVDQMPGRLHAEDVTERVLAGGGLWAGNGVPYFAESLNASSIEADESAHRTSWLVGQANVTRLADVDRVMRSRAYRGDVMDGDRAEGTSVYGNIDLKLFSETSDAQMEFRAFAGPLYYRGGQARACAESDSGMTTTVRTAADSGRSADADASTEQPAELVAGRGNGDDNDCDVLDTGALSEIDLYEERRPARDDMRATAMLRSKHTPFRWSQTDLAVGHSGHPDVFDFGPVSPSWAWSLPRAEELTK